MCMYVCIYIYSKLRMLYNTIKLYCAAQRGAAVASAIRERRDLCVMIIIRIIMII